MILKFEIIEKTLRSNIQILEHIQKNGLVRYLLVENTPTKIIFYMDLISFVSKKESDYSKVKKNVESLSLRKNTKVKILFIDEVKKEIDGEIFESIYNELQRLNLIKSRQFKSELIYVNSDDFNSSLNLLNLLSDYGPREYILSYDLINYMRGEKEFANNIKYNIDKVVFSKKSFLIDLFKKIPVLEKFQFINILNRYLLISVRNECILHLNSLEYYNSAYEVYNRLYNFYSSHGDALNLKHVHYRRGEAYRKLLLSQGGLKNILRAIIFDGMIQKGLTGYGDDIGKPVRISTIVILLCSLLFRLLNGLYMSTEVPRDLNWFDYLYFSFTIFTGLGFSNIQPDITIPLIQPLIMIESTFGVMIIALIIFVITYQISR